MIPLQSVDVIADVIDINCEVNITQKYRNDTSSAIEAVYNFPIDELAAVVGFVAEIDGKKIVAKCMEKQKAADTYLHRIFIIFFTYIYIRTQ
jgi:hypothetical protein